MKARIQRNMYQKCLNNPRFNIIRFDFVSYYYDIRSYFEFHIVMHLFSITSLNTRKCLYIHRLINDYLDQSDNNFS